MASTSRAALSASGIGDILLGDSSESEESSDEDYIYGDDESDGSQVSENSESDGSEGPPAARRCRPNPDVAGRLPSFQWCDGDFSPTLFPFSAAIQGIKPDVALDEDSQELDPFLIVFHEQIVQHIAKETNDYFKHVTEDEPSEKSKLHKWTDTNTEEMYVFLATFILMGLQKKTRIRDYWSTDPLISSPFFSKIMGSERFLLMLRLLHCCPSVEPNPDPNVRDKLQKVRPIITKLKESFCAVFSPHKDICIDESLMLWKGRLAFRQYIPSKRNRFGIKLFLMCDVQTGFILDFIVYTGSSTEYNIVNPELGISGAIVLTMMDPYLGKGHCLYTDNWYTSPKLASCLHDKQTGICGTVRINRKGCPTDFPAKMTKGQLREKHTDTLLAVKWHDRRDVHMLSSVSETGIAGTGKFDRRTREEITKPKCVLDYNKKMGAVDKVDMQVSFSECLRKSVKWSKKFFFHLLDLAIYNSYILYKCATNKKPELTQYRLELVRQILEKFHKERKSPKGGRPSKGETPLRLTERHFADYIPATEKKANPLKRCHVCSQTTVKPRRRKETRFMCRMCDVALCIVPCFNEYHNLRVF